MKAVSANVNAFHTKENGTASKSHHFCAKFPKQPPHFQENGKTKCYH